MIERYVDAGVGDDLLTASERKRRGKQVDKRREKEIPSSPAVPLRQKRRRDDDEGVRHTKTNDTKNAKKKKPPLPHSSSASDDELIDELVNDQMSE
jgi:hypothetical protein